MGIQESVRRSHAPRGFSRTVSHSLREDHVSERLPAWFRQEMPDQALMQSMESKLAGSKLHTICQSAHCPNAGQCFSRKTATFLILGDRCTRHCTFCAVKKGTAS